MIKIVFQTFEVFIGFVYLFAIYKHQNLALSAVSKEQLRGGEGAGTALGSC